MTIRAISSFLFSGAMAFSGQIRERLSGIVQAALRHIPTNLFESSTPALLTRPRGPAPAPPLVRPRGLAPTPPTTPPAYPPPPPPGVHNPVALIAQALLSHSNRRVGCNQQRPVCYRSG